jgi:hypothetical protein
MAGLREGLKSEAHLVDADEQVAQIAWDRENVAVLAIGEARRAFCLTGKEWISDPVIGITMILYF